MITAADVWEKFDYNPTTGEMIAKTGRRKGQSVGYSHVKGHRMVSVNCEQYYFHRVVWLWMTGSWPDGQIDHINRVRDDNRWFNLRVVSQLVNSQNRIGRGYYRFQGKFRSRITVLNKTMFLGDFETEEEARHAYLEAKRLHHKCG